MLSDYKNCRELWKDWLRENRVTPSLLPLISYLCAIVPLVFKLGAWGVFVGLAVFLACLFMPVGKKRILLAALYVIGLVQCSPLSLSFSRSYRQLLPREECHVEMRLRAVGAMRSKETFREVMRVVEIRDSNGEWRPCDGEVLVRGDRGESIELNNGDEIEVEGALPEIGRLQGANDGYVRHLRSLGVGHVLHAGSMSACEVKRATGWRAMMQRFYGLREVLGVWLTEGMSEECGNLYQAMMLGRRDLFPAGVREHFLRSSSLHVFAISGLHIGIV
jgi:hypothetical protein